MLLKLWGLLFGMMPKGVFAIFLLFSSLLISCQREDSSPKSAVKFPNDGAPLALLMREMYLDLEEIREEVSNKKLIKSYLEKHKDLLNARPTDPKVKDATFQIMGIAYLKSLENVENSNQELLGDNYGVLVSSCLGCHEQHCPGPVKRINKLILE